MAELDRPATRQRLAVFPLAGAVLFPGMQLPLHIFEPRYRAMVSACLAGDRRIGMIQPRTLVSKVEESGKGSETDAGTDAPALFDMGCVGRITDVEALDDGRYNILLEGLARFHLVRELDVSTPFRQIEAEIEAVRDDEYLASVERAALEQEARRFAERQGYMVDWNAVSQLDDTALVNGIAQVAPFDAAAKQAMLEATGINARAELIMQLMQFFGRRDADDDRVTLQ